MHRLGQESPQRASARNRPARGDAERRPRAPLTGHRLKMPAPPGLRLPNPHAHLLVLEGVYRSDGTRAVFSETRAPTQSGIAEVTCRMQARVLRELERQGMLRDPNDARNEAVTVRGAPATGSRAAPNNQGKVVIAGTDGSFEYGSLKSGSLAEPRMRSRSKASRLFRNLTDWRGNSIEIRGWEQPKRVPRSPTPRRPARQPLPRSFPRAHRMGPSPKKHNASTRPHSH